MCLAFTLQRTLDHFSYHFPGSPKTPALINLGSTTVLILMHDLQSQVQIHWRIQGGCQGCVPSKFFHFHVVLAKNLKNNSTFGSWRTPLGKILALPLTDPWDPSSMIQSFESPKLTLQDPVQGGSRIPHRRGHQPSRRGVPTYKFARCSQKLHEIKRILVSGGGHMPEVPPWICHCYVIIFTAHKVCEGYVLTVVCLYTGGGGSASRGVCIRRVCILGWGSASRGEGALH